MGYGSDRYNPAVHPTCRAMAPKLRNLLKVLRSSLRGEGSVTEAAGDNARFHTWSGDVFFDLPSEPVVYQVRIIPREYLAEARERTPDRFHVIQPSSRLRLLS